MAEILLPDCQFPRLSDGATCRDIQPQVLCQACTAHVQVAALRTRLESVEAAGRDAQESRFGLIVENEELGADLAATRSRLESAEAALHFYANEDNWFPGVGINRGLPCSVEADEGKIARTALATANDGNTG
jgi:hypothetical protein